MESKPITHGFGLTRTKIFNGEGLDISIPTFDGPNGIGTFLCNHSYNWGRIVTLEEVIGELEIISQNTVDDKSQKREWRKQFLRLFIDSPIINVLFNGLTYYLNGGELDIKSENIGLIASGGNIILIFSSLVYLAIYKRSYFKRICNNILSLDVNFIDLCIINIRSIFYLYNRIFAILIYNLIILSTLEYLFYSRLCLWLWL